MGTEQLKTLKNGEMMAEIQPKRKKRRRPPRKCLRAPSPDELMKDPEFRRWRFHAPTSLKRQAYEAVKRLAGKGDRGSEKWTSRV
jgi:hypothetical protein